MTGRFLYYAVVYARTIPALSFLSVITLCIAPLCAEGAGQPMVTTRVVTYPSPPGETRSGDWAVEVNGRSMFCHTVGTLNGGPASFASFDFSGTVTIKVISTRPVNTAKALPASFGITPMVNGKEITFTLNKPRNVTIEINGGIDRALHILANPLETGAPKPGDPNVIYYGPGVHEVATLKLTDNQTLYLAGGAILRAVIPKDEKPLIEHGWRDQKKYAPFLVASAAKHVKIRGRGIIDLGLLPWLSRNTFGLSKCENLLIEGITILSAPEWVVALFECKNVTIRNVKEICKGENSDGVDICNSQDVLVEGGFYRNNDDEICVKTTLPPPAQESKNIIVRGAVIWNEHARGLGITSETRANISNVLFQDCDIIHDLGNWSCLAILVSDSGTMSNIRFEDIRIEDTQSAVFDCWVGADQWATTRSAATSTA